MNPLLKKLLLLWLILFSTSLHADTDNKINIADAPNITEGDIGDSNKEMVFQVTLTQKSWVFTVEVDYQIYSGSATAGEDFVTSSGTLSFAPKWSDGGEDTKEIIVPIIGDDDYEGNENLYIVLTNPTNDYIIDDDRGYGTIIDNETAPITLTLHNRAEVERDSNWILNFTARLSQPAPAGGVTINYETSDGVAKSGYDYIDTNGTITIPQGIRDGFIPVEIIGDEKNENTEQFHLDITSIIGATLHDGNALGTIYDDDPIKFYISDERVTEGASGTTQEMTFTVSLLKKAPLDGITIDYYTQNGSATAGADYTATTGTLTFNENDRTKTITVTILGDDEIEYDEYFGVRLSNNSHGTISDSYGNGRIDDDDGSFSTIEFDHWKFSIIEGNISQQDLNFTFTITPASPIDAVFKYGTWSQLGSSEEHIAENEDGDNDYISTYGTKIIPAGSTSITIPVKINGDTKIEKNEEFYFYIYNLDKINMGGAGAVALGKIINDDGTYPTLSCISDIVSIEEGDSGQKSLNYIFTLDKPAFSETSFEYKTVNDTTDGSDYIAIATTPYSIAEGESNISISVQINGDIDIEPDERFYLELSELLNLDSSSCDRVQSNIINDDGDTPIVSIEAPVTSFNEGNSGTTRVDFSFKLDRPAHKDGLKLKFRTKDGTATKNDDDYEEILPTTVIFNAGESEKNASVYINGDELIEMNESFYIEMYGLIDLEGNGNYILKITITNDDEHNGEPFECLPEMYLSSSIKRGTLETGRMWLHQIDTSKNPFEFKVVYDAGSDELYNAIGYSEVDNYIYGLYYNRLIKLSKTGKIIDLGVIDGLPDDFNTTQLFAGAIYNGEYFVTGPNGGAYNKMFKINIANKNVTEITLNPAVSILDFSFDSNGTYLYGIANGGKLTKIDASDGNVTFIGDAHTGYQFDSSFSDKNGRFFANDSLGNGFFEFDLTTGTKSYISSSQRADYNDGANCINASLAFTDYGDAPISYGEPRHDIRNSIFMGDEVDHESSAYHSVGADGDDSNDIDDEDGVILGDGSDINESIFETNSTQELKVKVSKDGFLNVWIDYNIDGDFDDAGEQIFTAKALVAGENSINFLVPDNLIKLHEASYIRFRYSSTSNLNATENAMDGEVEDYMIEFTSPFKGVRGRFNIQRTDTTLDSKDFALYTQIAGRDFDYHIVFYDENLTAEEELEKVPLKIDLIDENSRDVLYTAYYYFSHSSPSSRVLVIDASDLDNLPATKKALFQITYAVDADGSIAQQECGADYQGCFETTIIANDFNRTDDAKDMFAIRPEKFFVTIADGDIERINSNYSTDASFSSGYEYNLTARAIKYIGNYPSFVSAIGYDATVGAKLDFNSSLSCANSSDVDWNITFSDGEDTDDSFSHNNVGRYILTLADDSNWTAVDQNGRDCDSNNSLTSTHFNTPSGCDISQIDDIGIIFQPDHFDVSLTLNNLPNSGHSDFLYMSELNATYNRMAIQFEGDIIAQNEDNETTTNFTAGCVSSNLLLDLNSTTISIDEINGTRQLNGTIWTKDATATVNFTRWIKFNRDANISNLDINRTLSRVEGVVKINANRFLNENNGTTHLDMRYNLNKHPSRAINPVQVSFNSIEVDSAEANSTAHDKINIPSNIYIPKGRRAFMNNVKNFYYTRVVSDLQSYPRVNMNISPIVRTPLNVDIYCDTNVTDYCRDTNVIVNSRLSGTTREQTGWYISAKHNGEEDGNVTELNDDPNIVTTRNNLVDAENNDTTLDGGGNNLLDARVDDCSVFQSTTVTISTTPPLRYPSSYEISCTENNASQWTGVGQTGNILNVRPKINESGKMDW